MSTSSPFTEDQRETFLRAAELLVARSADPVTDHPELPGKVNLWSLIIGRTYDAGGFEVALLCEGLCNAVVFALYRACVANGSSYEAEEVALLESLRNAWLNA